MYTIRFHTLVLRKDFKNLSRDVQRKIVRAIYKKLTVDPFAFGKPLLHELKGYYRLRIDPYRIVYRVSKKEVTVFVIHVGLRKDFIVYLETAKRLGLL